MEESNPVQPLAAHALRSLARLQMARHVVSYGGRAGLSCAVFNPGGLDSRDCPDRRVLHRSSVAGPSLPRLKLGQLNLLPGKAEG